MTRISNQLDEFWDAIVSEDEDKAARIESQIESESNSAELSGVVDVLKQLGQTRNALIETSRLSRFELPPGSKIGNYEVVDVLGRGGMGIVYCVLQSGLNRCVALKCIHANIRDRSKAIKRFRDEAAMIARLKHPNIVAVHEIGEHEDNWFYTMDLISDASLSERLKRQPMDPGKAARLMVDVAGAIHFAHQQNILHRDIKPSNILLDDQGKPFVSDFGLAFNVVSDAEKSRFTQTGSIIGTPNYLSPEQAMANSDLQSATTDVYGMGATLYEMLCGRPPFASDNLWNTLRQIVESEPLAPAAINPAVPEELSNICLKCLEKEPSRRYATAAAFQDDLNRYLNGEPVHAQPATSLNKILKWCRREPRLAYSLAATGALLLLLTISSIVYSLVIQAERNRATAATEAAVQDRSAAVDALERLVDSLYYDLSDDATTIRTREMVVTAAIEGLESLTHSEIDRRSDRTSFKAHLRIGDLAALKGSNQLAETHYQSAIELARQLRVEEPGNHQFQRDLAAGLSKFGQHLLATGDAKSVDMLSESKTLFEEMVAADSTDIELIGQLLLLHGAQLKLIRMQAPTEPAKVIEYGDEVLPLLQQAEKLDMGNRTYDEAAQGIYFLLGRARLEAYQAIKAESEFARAEKHIERLLAAAPRNRSFRAAAGALTRGRGMAIGAQGDLQRATPYLERAVNEFRQLAADDPDDHLQAQNLANTNVILSMARQFAGKREQAIRLLQESMDVYQKLVEASPTDDTSRALVINARMQVIDNLLLLGRWEDAYQQVQLAQQEMTHEFAEMFQQTLATHRANLKPVYEALSCLISQPPSEISVAGKCYGLLLIAHGHAANNPTFSLSPERIQQAARIIPDFEGTAVDDLLEIVNQFSGDDPLLTYTQFVFETRVYGLIARNASVAGQPTENSVGDQAFLKCQEAIRKLAKVAPIITDTVMNEADLIWFREQPEFEEFWKTIAQPADE